MFAGCLLSACAPQFGKPEYPAQEGSAAEFILTSGWGFYKDEGASRRAGEMNGVPWRRIALPHDWAISGPFNADADGSQGKLPWKGVGWYRRLIDKERHGFKPFSVAYLLFGGVMSNPTVYLDRTKVGSWGYGYNSFHVDITEPLRRGGPAPELLVRADTTSHHSRWYPGAGIFREVRLIVKNPIHIPVWGVGAKASVVSTDRAELHVATEIKNASRRTKTVAVLAKLIDGDGLLVAKNATSVPVKAGRDAVAELELAVAKPKLWGVDTPHLYRLEVSVAVDSKTTDTVVERVGFRSFEWTADRGFFLNGRRLQLKGVNLHHDNGPLGAALYKDSLRRKFSIMKDMGVNALRTSHNPPDPEFLGLADEMGFVVIDELFDKYGKTASKDVSTKEYVKKHAEAEVRNFIRRDRNHPCIVAWSIGNEVGDVLRNEDGRGARHVRRMYELFRKYDDTRPIMMSAHITSAIKDRVLDAVDVQGWNYGQKYALARIEYPETPQVYTESASAFSTRGHYRFPHPRNKTDFDADFKESSYDHTAADWADITDVEFRRMERDAYVAGEFVWTGFDYLGEPTPHTQDARSSYFGIVDLVGLPKDRYYLYRSHWNEKDETVHLLPHWTWPGKEGQIVPVYVYTSGDEAELFLNGRSLGKKRKRADDDKAFRRTGNLARGSVVRASSEYIVQDENGNVLVEDRADKLVDGSVASQWSAGDAEPPFTIDVDLGEPQVLGAIDIDWGLNDEGIRFDLEASEDGKRWIPFGNHQSSRRFVNRTVNQNSIEARHVRLTIHRYPTGARATIREMEILSRDNPDVRSENPYLDAMDFYRLRWENAVYQPGELRVVAYRDKRAIGEDSRVTAGPPRRLRLVAETDEMVSDGRSLAYLTVEATDERGVVAPNAMNEFAVSVDGPGELIGIGNGDPLSLDPFQDEVHSLFHGKAVAIVRSVPGQPGKVRIEVASEGLSGAAAEITSVAPRGARSPVRAAVPGHPAQRRRGGARR